MQTDRVAPDIRPYDRDRDLASVDRIWREVGWFDDDYDIASLDRVLNESNVEVAMLDDVAESAVAWVPGSIRYQHTDLPLCAVTAVTTSRIGRKQGFATTMTARAVRDGAAAGAAVAALGMFDQGFYDRVGFGSGVYEHMVRFDPSRLDLNHIPYRRPARLTKDDHRELYDALHRRHRGHGAVLLNSPALMESECEWIPSSYGLGYRQDGRLTHFVFGRAVDEHGPYRVNMLSFEEPRQLLELLRLLAELGDQVDTIRMFEPTEVQLQDLLRSPLRTRRQTEGSAHATGIASEAWMQFRLLDLGACIAARSWPGEELRFNLTLTDPAPGLLDDDWTGVAGDYVVTVGPKSSLNEGSDPGLQHLDATVNAFSRLWFGVRPASSLALTERLDGPASLLTRLDESLALPPPKPGWEF